MKTLGKLFFACLLLQALAPAPAQAAVPGRVSYQGTLRKSGVLFNGTAAMGFASTSQDGSTVYWTADSTNVAVAAGLFRYQLGTPHEDVFAAIPWRDITPSVRVKIDGGWLPPEPLYTSPYSVHAYSAETSYGTFLVRDGDVRISTTAGSRGIRFQDGSVQYSASGPDNLGTHTASQNLNMAGYNVTGAAVVFASSVAAAGPALTVGSELWLPGSRFGIGTPSPVAQLHISTSAGSAGNMLVISTGVARVIRMTGAGAIYATKYYGDGSALTGVSGGGGGGADNLGDHTLTTNLITGTNWLSGDGDSEGVYVDPTGNVGVGGSAFGARFDVRGSVGNNIQAWRNSGGVVVASMTAAGLLYADASQMRNLPSGADNLGDHTATQNLDLAAKDIVNVSTITTGYVASSGPGVLFSTNALVMKGSLGVNTFNPTEKLHVNGNILSAPLAGAGNRCVYADASGVLRVQASDCGLIGPSGDHLGNHTATQNINLGANWLSPDGTAKGLTLAANGNAGLGVSGAVTRLDVQPAGGDLYSQVWRDTGGTVVSSMNAQGQLYADASQLRNLPSGADDLGSHTATQDLNLAGRQVLNVSSLTVTGAPGASLSRVRFAQGVELSSAPAARLGGVYVSSNVFIVGVSSAAKYYGDGSALTGLTGVADNLGNHTATQNLNLAAKDIVNVSTITTGYVASSGPGVLFSTNALVMKGSLGVNTYNPTEKLHVNGNILSAPLAGSGNRCVYADASGVLRVQASDCGLIGPSGDHLGNHTATQNINLGANWLSPDGTAKGLTLAANGNAGLGVSGAVTRLDVQPAGGDLYSQVWRDTGGTVVSSMNALGQLYADASQLRNLPSGADDLGSHTAAQNLNMAAFDITNVSTITLGYLAGAGGGVGVVVSTNLLVREGNLGVNTDYPQEKLHVQGNILSSSLSGVSNRCVFVDAFGVLRAKGSDCGLASPTGDNLGDYAMIQNLATGGNWISNDGASVGLYLDASGNAGIGNSVPAARLDVRGAVGPYIQAWRNPAGAIVASMTVAGILYGDGSQLRNLPSSADNLGSHVMSQPLVTAGNWISGDGDAEGLLVDGNGNLGVGEGTPATRLDVRARAADAYAQIWRDSSGVIQASVAAAGYYYGDGSKLRNITAAGDNLGSHTAAAPLLMSGFAINNAGAVTAAGQVTTYSSVTVAGAAGLGAPRVRLNPGVELSSAPAAQYGGVYVSSNVYLAAGARYYGDSADLHRAVLAPGVELSSAPAAQHGGVYVSSNIYLAAGARYYGDGSALSGFTDTGAVRKGGDAMTGQLTLAGSTLTVTGNSFSVTGVGFMVAPSGYVGVGTLTPGARLEVNDNDADTATSGLKFTNFACAGTEKLTATAAGAIICAADQAGTGNVVDTLSATLGANNDAGGLNMLNLGSAALGSASAAARLDVRAAGGDVYSQIWRDSGGTIMSSMTADGILYADAAGLRNLPAGGGSDNLGDHTATQNLDLADFELLNVSTLTAAAGEPGVMVDSDLLVNGDVASRGRSAFGNLAYLVDASSAVTIAQRFSPAASVHNNSAVRAYGEANPGSHMAGAPVHTMYGGSFEAAVMGGNIYNFGALTGVGGMGAYYGSASLDSAYGVMGVGANVFNGAVTSAYGGFFTAAAGVSGAIDNTIAAGYGVFAQNGVYTAASSMGASFAVFAQTPAGFPGRMARNYGVYVNDQTGYGTVENYNIYSAGYFSRNYFAGSVGIGNKVPLASLHISSGAGYAGNLLLVSTGGVNVISLTGGGEVHAAKFFGDGSALTNIPGGVGMANPAIADLDMSDRGINNAAHVRLNPGIELSSATAAFQGGVYISSNVYLAPGAKFYGDGSKLSNVAGGTGMANPAIADLDMNSRDVINASTIAPVTNLYIKGDIRGLNFAGAANRCVYADSAGVLRVKTEDCGTGGGGGALTCTNPNNPSDVMVAVGDFCVDKYEATVWSSVTGGTQYGTASDNYPCGDNAQNCGVSGTPVYALSLPGYTPSANITWFQASVACANSGKHLITNAEWQAAVVGTSTGTTGLAPQCNYNGAAPTATGGGTSCLSAAGAENMVGSLFELVADWGMYTPNDISGTWPAGPYDSNMAASGAGGPGAATPLAVMARGGAFGMPQSGVFAFYTGFNPGQSDSGLGFRCAMQLR